MMMQSKKASEEREALPTGLSFYLTTGLRKRTQNGIRFFGCKAGKTIGIEPRYLFTASNRCNWRV
jgi:hypothetical protein